MIRFILRFFGLLCLALGFIFVVYDGTKMIADHVWDFSSVGSTWSNIHQNSLTSLQPAVERLVTSRDLTRARRRSSTQRCCDARPRPASGFADSSIGAGCRRCEPRARARRAEERPARDLFRIYAIRRCVNSAEAAAWQLARSIVTKSADARLLEQDRRLRRVAGRLGLEVDVGPQDGAAER